MSQCSGLEVKLFHVFTILIQKNCWQMSIWLLLTNGLNGWPRVVESGVNLTCRSIQHLLDQIICCTDRADQNGVSETRGSPIGALWAFQYMAGVSSLLRSVKKRWTNSTLLIIYRSIYGLGVYIDYRRIIYRISISLLLCFLYNSVSAAKDTVFKTAWYSSPWLA